MNVTHHVTLSHFHKPLTREYDTCDTYDTPSIKDRISMMTTTDDLLSAVAEQRQQFQRLTFLLEAKGILSAHDLTEVYGEASPPFRAGSADVCCCVLRNASDDVADVVNRACQCTHAVLTSAYIALLARDLGRGADSQSVAHESNRGDES